MNPTEVWASHSDPDLLNALFAVAKAMQIPLTAVNVEKVGTADSESFRAADIPRTTIHSVDQRTLAVLHSDADNTTAIHPDLYYESYRLIAEIPGVVDARFDRAGNRPHRGEPKLQTAFNLKNEEPPQNTTQPH